MNVAKTMSSDLPLDVARLLLEHAARNDQETAVALALVSKAVRKW